MAGITREYLKTIIPEGMPNGMDLLKEGEEIGKTFEAKPSAYYKARGFNGPGDYTKASREDPNSKPTLIINVGMPTLEETVNGCVELARWARETLGVEIMGATLCSINLGIPKEKRDPNMDTNAYMLETLEDYEMQNNEECYMPVGNHALVVPNAIETVVNSLKAGLPGIGTTSQLTWDYPGCDDHVEDVANTVRALGIMKHHRNMGATSTCYTEDGLASCCVDTIGFIAYYLFENYIYDELCGVPISCGFGALCSDNKTKAALMLAVDGLSDMVGHPALSFVHGSCTTQWDHDVNANFGSSMQEFLMLLTTEKKYHTGAAFLTVPVTEALRVPTMQELKDIASAGARLIEFTDQWVDIINWDEIEERAEIIKREGIKMYHNMMETLEDLGLDMKDPMQLLMFIKNVDGALFEPTFHPSIREKGYFEPNFPNDMGGMTMGMVEETVEELKEKGYDDEFLKGKTVILGSTDTHSYGARYVTSVLNAFGCGVVELGTDCTVQQLLDTADEEGLTCIGVSSHSGNALGIAEQMRAMTEKRDKTYKVFMGGVLNSILPGHKEAVDVDDLINDMGILGTNDMEKTINLIKSV